MMILVWAAVALKPAGAGADDAQGAQRLSDAAFAMLNNLNSSSAAGASDAQGAVASFAGDAQSLASALAKGDNDSGSQAMAALVADCTAVDRVIAKYPGLVDEARWAAMKTLLASIKHDVPPSRARSTAAVPSEADLPPPAAESATLEAAPRVKITYRVFEGGAVRVLGYLQGTGLKTAGIYENGNLLHEIKLGDTTGRQRIDFNLKLRNVTPDDTIQVTDAFGRAAEALIAPQAATEAPSTEGRSKSVEIGPDTGASGATAPAEVASGTANTYEIPSHKGMRKRSLGISTGPSELADVQINILGVLPTSKPNTYQVLGQISGAGIQRAGIYVDARLVKRIPVTPGQYASFDAVFTMLGRQAEVRVFDRHNNYVASPFEVTSTSGRMYGINPPIGTSPYAYGVNPYPSPYGYPVTPYVVSPYGVNPYGSVNPYAPVPYGSPYGYPNTPNALSWPRTMPPRTMP